MNEEETTTFMMLSNDLILNCLARVSRLNYPTLSLVSKRFRSILASTELYQTRTLLGLTESCLYVYFELTSCDRPQQWFTLCQRPNSSKKFLVPITCPNSPCTYYSDFARVGSSIYAIGGYINHDDETCSVMVMDCRSHTWREAPSMRVARGIPSACDLDGKIYVTGGCKNLNATSWMEVFDTKTQTWEFELSGCAEKVCGDYIYKSVGFDGNVYVKCYQKPEATYKLNNGRWRETDIAISRGWYWSSPLCVIENVLFTCIGGVINWYDFEERHWNHLKGLERWKVGDFVKLAECGGKLAILWVERESVNEKIIWCAQVTLEKRQDGMIWGTLDWAHLVFTTNEGFSKLHLLSVTL